MSALFRAPPAVASLLEARLAGRPLRAFPTPLPTTLAEAYRIQRELRAGLGAPVLGWKVGRIPPGLVEELGATRLAGPVFRIDELAGRAPGAARVIPGGAGAVEAEVMLLLTSVPQRRLATDAEARTHVGDVRAGFEVASSPAPDVHAHAPFSIIADIGINNGLLLGPRLGDDFAALQVTTEIEGTPVGTGRPCDVLDGPLGSLRFLVDLHHDGVIALAPGQWISAGAVTGVHPIDPGQAAVATFGPSVRIACTAVRDPGFGR